MIQLKPATHNDWKIIQSIAYITWPDTFGKLIDKEQLDYMLTLIYSEASLKSQMIQHNHQFLLVLNDETSVGFVSYELNYGSTTQLMIHKIYLLPESQGLGIGTKIFNHLTEVAKNNHQEKLRLKVFHKNDKAIGFYQKYGFTSAGVEMINIDNKYTVLDNVMIKEIE